MAFYQSLFLLGFNNPQRNSSWNECLLLQTTDAKAWAKQLKNVQTGLVVNISGSGTSNAVSVLEAP
ncbi:hypothetical protein QYS49_33050 [Marivirga salinae]|uniref:Uncharacterized protein n=1 Tax=Marivirga salinarum TaxID=3059078 RepID=A0AA51REE0_9BACT|nr:hypothetical protein [Marivirga sp. BDSF4-3]WMN12269.1 hypothetical protein QYS49_33050 [Marivirga sp. BDSF4-3]